MATEMFLKGLLASTAGLTDYEARTEIGHNLQEALNKCLALNPQSELSMIQQEIGHFPAIGERYKGAEIPARQLWKGYGVAQFSRNCIGSDAYGRDCRKTIRFD